jgi:hypothetical protein
MHRPNPVLWVVHPGQQLRRRESGRSPRGASGCTKPRSHCSTESGSGDITAGPPFLLLTHRATLGFRHTEPFHHTERPSMATRRSHSVRRCRSNER